MSTAPVSIWRATRSPWGDNRANWRFESLSATGPIRFPLRSTQMRCQSGVPPLPITSAGGGGVHVPRGEVIGNPVGYDLCVSAELSRCRIELLRHQLAATCEQHKAAGVDGVGQRAEQGTVLRAIERGEVHGVILGLDGIVIDGDIKKVLTIRKKEGPAMRSVPGPINFRSRDRGPAIGADSHNGRLCVCGQEDHAVRSPGASASLRGVANHARRATVESTGGPARSPVSRNEVPSGGAMTVRMARAG
jgi:hypothetical protein